jgi:phospholipase/lecithinase/hemolysin
MNSMFSRTLKALLAVAVVGVVVACGSSTTVDPFKPTRVIGLGDAHNDMSGSGTERTVRGTSGVATVVQQVAALFGVTAVQSSVVTGDSTVVHLNTQVDQLGPLQATDLIVITSGAADYLAGGSAGAANYLTGLTTALDKLKAKGATHILLMQVVDKSVNIDNDVVSFNSVVSAGLSQYADVARLANIDRPAAFFPYWATNTDTPYCGVGSTAGCAVGANDPELYFLADSVYPTPVGNRWIAQYMYNVTASGWR